MMAVLAFAAGGAIGVVLAAVGAHDRIRRLEAAPRITMHDLDVIDRALLAPPGTRERARCRDVMDRLRAAVDEALVEDRAA